MSDRKVGRPLKYDNVEDLQKAIDEYFSADTLNLNGVEMIKPFTMSGLALSLGLSRQGLLNYTNKDEYFDTIKEARQKIEVDIETRLMMGIAPAGCIFNLKNNFGWRDRFDQEVKIDANVSLKSILDDIDGDSTDLPERD